MLKKYRSIFKLRLGSEKPAKVEPMRMEVKESARPIIAKARQYPKEHRDFMDKYVAKLKRYGMVMDKPNETWAAASLVVPKAPSANYRRTFNYRPINAVTIPMAWPMPHIESKLADVSGSRQFAMLDFCSCYWKMPLHPESQNYLSFLTSDSIVMPPRATQGPINAGPIFQSGVFFCFKRLRERCEDQDLCISYNICLSNT